MPAFLMVLLAFIALTHGGDGPEDDVMFARIHFMNKPAMEAWVNFEGARFRMENPENGPLKHPIPGRRVLFMNKFGRTDSLVYCEKKYWLPDRQPFLIRKTMSFDSIRLIEDITSDSLRPIPYYKITWLDPKVADWVTKRKPVFTDIIDLVDMGVSVSDHVYNYDSTYTKKRIRGLYQKGGRNNPELKNAIQENRLLFVEESSP